MAIVFEEIFEYVDKDQFFKYFKLLIFVAGYIFFRQIYSNYMKMKQVQRQIKEDELERERKPEEDRRKREEQETKLEEEAKTFGWGKKTRKNVKKAENLMEETRDQLQTLYSTAYDAAEDHDIDYLLED